LFKSKWQMKSTNKIIQKETKAVHVLVIREHQNYCYYILSLISLTPLSMGEEENY